MSNGQTFFEQIPVETVKKIFREKIRRAKKKMDPKDSTLPQPAAAADLPSREPSISQH